MNEFVQKLGTILLDLTKDRENTKVAADKLKSLLNNFFGEGFMATSRKLECKNVYVSKNNSTDPFYVIIIPKMPHKDDSILTQEYLYEYEVDIDFDNIVNNHKHFGLTIKELVAYFIHELYSNVLSDITFLRYKKNFIEYYDTRNKTIVSAHNNLGLMSWIGVFGNTTKCKIVEGVTNDYVSNMLKELGLAESWNSALDKYVIACGGDFSMITPDAVARDDKACTEMFVKLARQYAIYRTRYITNDYDTFVKYLSTSIGSELIKARIDEEPEHVMAVDEKDSWKTFSPIKSLRENVDEIPEREIPLYNKLAAQVNDIELDIKNIETTSDKLLCAAKLKDALRNVQDAILKDNQNEDILELRERIYDDVRELKEIEVNAYQVAEEV